MVGQVGFATSITATKISLVLLYHRIFQSRKCTIIGRVVGVIMVLWWISFILSVQLECRPVQYFWDKSIPGGHCISHRASEIQKYTLAAATTITDIIVWLLPLPWLWRLQLNPRKKVGIVVTFALGGL